MANQSISDAFERMWQHVTAALADKADKSELLWENASPTSDFTEQTISLDLSPYKFIEVYAQSHLNNTNYADVYGKTPIIVGKKLRLETTINNANGVDNFRRSLSLVEGGINVENGYFDANASSSSCIPMYIYGIK